MSSLTREIKIYIFFISTIAFAIIFQSFFSISIDINSLKVIIFFIFISIVSESLTIQLPKGGNFSVTFAVDLACIMLFGPNIAAWVTLSGELFKKDCIRGKIPYYKIIFNSAQSILSVWLAGNTYILLGGIPSYEPVSSIMPFVGASLAYSIVNITAVTIVLALAHKTSPWGIWLVNFRWVTPNVLALAPLGLLMANVYIITGVLGVSLFFVPLLLARYVFKSYMEIRQNYLDTLEALAMALDAKDRYTKGHADRVAKYAVEIARELKLPDDEIDLIEQAALLHDIGKIGVSSEILNRKGKLTDVEFEQIKLHPVTGANILKEISDFGDAIEYIRSHHEKYDGTGYPDRLKGEKIPFGARIITLVDSFDAMTSDRSYRSKMNFGEAIMEVKRCSGSHFDPQIVEAFLQVWEKGTEHIPVNNMQTVEGSRT